MQSVQALLATVIVSTISACAAGEAAPPPPPPADAGPPSMATVEAYCSARATAECTAGVMQECGATDVTACQTARRASCTMLVPEGTTYQPAQAPACVAAATSLYASGTVTATGQAAVDLACGTQLFAGPGAARAPCTSDYDCNSAVGLSCVTPTGETSAKCLVPNVVPNGGPCPNEQDECEGSFYCNPQSLECVRDAILSEPCGQGWTPCASGLFCGGSGPFASCAAKPAVGAACARSTDCASGLCDKLSDQAQGNCVEQIVLSPLDSLCATFK